MNQNQIFTYFAFISYNHKDEKWAKWLQKKLESYRLPTVIRKESGKKLPKRISPVFLDSTDLAVGKLNAKLNQELEASRYLIVICSPNSAKTNAAGLNYVNAEVTYFSALGRDDAIIPVIVEGSPGSDDRNCFCPKIHELGLVGLDATKHPRARILNDVVAKILGLRPDELWQREKRRVRRKRIMGSLAGAFLLAIALFAGGVAWDWNRDHTEYYADYADQWGMPVGLFHLKKEQTRSLHSHYRFVYRNREKLFGKRILREVIHCNSAGMPSDPVISKELPGDFTDNVPHREVRQKLGYDSDFKLNYIDVCDSHDVLLEHRVYSGKHQNAIDFKRKDKDDAPVGAAQQASGLTETENESEIQRWRIVRDELGRPRTIMFFRDENAFTPSRNENGFFGLEYEYDDLGRIVAEYFLNENGNRIALKDDLFSIRYAYLSNGPALISISMRDYQGSEMRRHEMSFDETGASASYSFFQEGKICLNDKGFAYWKGHYDEHGNMTEESFFGPDGKPCLNRRGFAKAVMRYDDRNEVVNVSFFDTDGRPLQPKEE